MQNLFKILPRAYKHTKNHRFLWFFGLFLSNLALVNFYRFNSSSARLPTFDHGLWMLKHFARANTGAFILGIAAAIVTILALTILNSFARACIINSIFHLERDENIKFKAITRATGKYFWRVFWLTAILNIMLFLTAVSLLSPSLFILSLGFAFRGSALFILGLSIFIPIFVILSVLNIFSACFIVIYNLHFFDAIKSAFDLFSRFLEHILAMFSVLLLIFAAVFMFSAGALGLAAVLAYGLGLLLKLVSPILYTGLILILLILVAGCLILVNSMLNVFTSASWTLLFLELVKANQLPQEHETAPQPVI